MPKVAELYGSVQEKFGACRNAFSSRACIGLAGDYTERRIIEPARIIEKIETLTKVPVGILRLTTNDGNGGYGQISLFEPDISATVLPRRDAPKNWSC